MPPPAMRPRSVQGAGRPRPQGLVSRSCGVVKTSISPVTCHDGDVPMEPVIHGEFHGAPVALHVGPGGERLTPRMPGRCPTFTPWNGSYPAPGRPSALPADRPCAFRMAVWGDPTAGRARPLHDRPRVTVSRGQVRR